VVGSGPDDVDGLEGDAPGKDPDAPSAAEVDEQEDRP
jgi:hypothetical protein